ncbi:MAG: hypothetical protein WBQ95_18355 [Terracidiphilus sp.]
MKKQEDHEEYYEKDDHEALPGTNLEFILACPVPGVSRRQGDISSSVRVARSTYPP